MLYLYTLSPLEFILTLWFALKTEPQQTSLLYELSKLRKNYEKSQQSDSYPPAPCKLKTEPTQYHSSHQSTVQHRSILKKEDAGKTEVRDERILLPPPIKKVKSSVLNLPMSPWEIAYAHLVEESRRPESSLPQLTPERFPSSYTSARGYDDEYFIRRGDTSDKTLPPPRKRKIRDEPADNSRPGQTSRPAPTSRPGRPAEPTVPEMKGP